MNDLPPEKAATIYDVAKAAGVSPSTVSRAFSRPGRVSGKTAARIHQVAAEIGYRTEHVVRATASGETKLIGMTVADITNPVFFSVIRGAEHYVTSAGYSMLLADAQESSDMEREWLDRTVPNLEGLIVSSSRLSDTSLRGIARSVSTVVLNRVVPGVPSIITDNPRGMRRALEHLTEFGHRRIAYVAGPSASWADGARWRAFKEACFELDLMDHRIGPVTPTVRGGFGAFHSVRESRVTAAVCYNDMIAIGLIRAARQAGFSIPQDLSVVGFDNIFASELITPALTTVAAPQTLLGEHGARAVLSMVNQGPNFDVAPMTLPLKLIVRDSTGPARRTAI